MADDIKKLQDEAMKELLKQQSEMMKEVYGENFSNVENLMKDRLNDAMNELDNIDLSAIQNAVPGVDMETILKKTQEAKEQAQKAGIDAIQSQAETITNSLNEMFSNSNMQDIISEQMKQFQQMTGIEDFTKMTPEDMQKVYENNLNMMNYISEQEAWEILDDIAEIMINNFNSWKEFGISYIIGGLFWTYRTNPEGVASRYYETVEALEGLMTKTDDEDDGLWLVNPWISNVI